MQSKSQALLKLLSLDTAFYFKTLNINIVGKSNTVLNKKCDSLCERLSLPAQESPIYVYWVAAAPQTQSLIPI